MGPSLSRNRILTNAPLNLGKLGTSVEMVEAFAEFVQGGERAADKVLLPCALAVKLKPRDWRSAGSGEFDFQIFVQDGKTNDMRIELGVR
jgi:hypothetical protein